MVKVHEGFATAETGTTAGSNTEQVTSISAAEPSSYMLSSKEAGSQKEPTWLKSASYAITNSPPSGKGTSVYSSSSKVGKERSGAQTIVTAAWRPHGQSGMHQAGRRTMCGCVTTETRHLDRLGQLGEC